MGMAPEADKKENNKAAAEDWVSHPTVTPLGYQKLVLSRCLHLHSPAVLSALPASSFPWLPLELNHAARLCQMSPTREREEPR